MTRKSFLLTASGLLRVQAQHIEPMSGLRGLYRRRETAGMTASQRVAFWEQKVKANGKDVEALLQLAAAFLQKNRETTDFSYVDRASSLLDRVLTITPDNYDALRLRLEVAMNHHRFARAVDYAAQLLERNPSDSGVTGLEGDALMEMGKYEEAGRLYSRMLELGGNLFSYNRCAYHRFVTGKTDEALGWMSQAVQAGSPEPENEAWCLVEFGDMLFKTGKIEAAESAYTRSLAKVPGYHRAKAAQGRLIAARGDLKKAIPYFQSAQDAVPFPEYAAALEVLHRMNGNPRDAERQRGLIDAIERLAKAGGEEGNRTLAIIYADQGRRLDRALELAQGELETRGDIYTYDALSWALYKNGKIGEAERASGEALRFETAEPSFYYHAGVIAAASGDRAKAADLLRRALALNPRFDVRDAPAARQALAQLGV